MLCIAQGLTPVQPKFHAIDDCYWAFIEQCWLSLEEQPLMKELITSLEQFLSSYPLPKTTLDDTPRPILSIETCGHGPVRHPSLSVPRGVLPETDTRATPISRTMANGSALLPNLIKTTSSKLHYLCLRQHIETRSPGLLKQRTKKIALACNFCRCRSHKLLWKMTGTESIISQLGNSNATAAVLPAVKTKQRAVMPTTFIKYKVE